MRVRGSRVISARETLSSRDSIVTMVIVDLVTLLHKSSSHKAVTICRGSIRHPSARWPSAFIEAISPNHRQAKSATEQHLAELENKMRAAAAV
jgi:hypothetical protein